MLSELLKEKGVHPPRFLLFCYVIHRRIVDRVKIVVDDIDKILQTKFKVCFFITCYIQEAFNKVITEYYHYMGGEDDVDTNGMFSFLLSVFACYVCYFNK